jgi:hypothetical protein
MYQGGCDKRTDTLGHAKTDTLSQDYSMIPMVLSQKGLWDAKTAPNFFSSFKKGNLYVFASLKGFLKKYLINSMVYDKKAGTKVLSLAVPEMSLAVFGKGNASLPLFPIK